VKSTEFRLLVMPYSSRLYRLAFGLLGNREEAEDAVQEVYLKLWNMRKELEKYSSIEALSVRIMRNLCLDVLRKRKTIREMQESTDKAESIEQNDPSDIMELGERAEILNKLINQLPEPQRSLVYYRHIEGKEYQEIGEMMEMKENAIRVSISRARQQLREMIKKHYAVWIN